jgi:hypothetical protein
MNAGIAAICKGATYRSSCRNFVDCYEGRYRDIQLPLPMRLV